MTEWKSLLPCQWLNNATASSVSQKFLKWYGRDSHWLCYFFKNWEIKTINSNDSKTAHNFPLTLRVDSFSLIGPERDYLTFFKLLAKEGNFTHAYCKSQVSAYNLDIAKYLKSIFLTASLQTPKYVGQFCLGFFLVLSQFGKQMFIYSEVMWLYYLFWHICLYNYFIVNKSMYL